MGIDTTSKIYIFDANCIAFSGLFHDGHDTTFLGSINLSCLVLLHLGVDSLLMTTILRIFFSRYLSETDSSLPLAS
jgi:hypothetical protein